MSVAGYASVPAVARHIAQRAGIVRRPRAPVALRSPVPRLRTGRTTASPTVWMLCPDWDRPAGGIRKQYRAVDVLNDAGLPAAIVHEKPRFACGWFEHETRIIAAADTVVGEGDVICVPEVYGPGILDLPKGVRQVIFNQNAYITLDSLVDGGATAAAPYVDNADLATVVVVSEDSAEALQYLFPHVPVKRIHHGLDPAVHHPPTEPAGKRITYMPRRRADEAASVLRLLELRGLLDDWEVVAIERRSETDAADLLRSSRIFLSFSEREGFGLPPLEALACGCLVVGFDGFAGREFFRSPFALSVEDGDVVAFARAVEELMRHTEDEPAAAAAAAAAGARFVRNGYSQEVERRDLVGVFAPLLRA
jgi:Glycosyl transferases group 1